MPYTIKWYIPDELIYVHYTGVVSKEELRDCLTTMKAFIESSPRPLVHAISDVGDVVESVPVGDSLRIVRDVGNHPRGGWTMSIREKSVLVKMGAALGSSLFKLRYMAFDNLEQAIHYLKNVDSTLSWDKAEPAVIEAANL